MVPAVRRRADTPGHLVASVRTGGGTNLQPFAQDAALLVEHRDCVVGAQCVVAGARVLSRTRVAAANAHDLGIAIGFEVRALFSHPPAEIFRDRVNLCTREPSPGCVLPRIEVTQIRYVLRVSVMRRAAFRMYEAQVEEHRRVHPADAIDVRSHCRWKYETKPDLVRERQCGSEMAAKPLRQLPPVCLDVQRARSRLSVGGRICVECMGLANPSPVALERVAERRTDETFQVVLGVPRHVDHGRIEPRARHEWVAQGHRARQSCVTLLTMLPPRVRPSRRLALVSFVALPLALARCAPPVSVDAGDVMDASAPDADPDADAEPIPDGPRGQILRVPLTAMEDWRIPTLRAPVHVIRTEANVPHIYASNARDGYVVQGFVAARDRYVQIELARRLGLGLVSNLLGDRGLAADQSSRDRGIPFVAERILAQLTPEQGDVLDAYAEGVNAYITAVSRRLLPLPTELGPVGLLLGTVRPWELMRPLTRRDLASVFAVVLFNSSFTSDDLERARAGAAIPGLFRGAVDEALHRDGTLRDIFNRVAPITNITSAPGFGLEMGPRMTQTGPRRLRTRPLRPGPRVPRDVLDRAIEADRQFALFRRGPRDADHGSNAWATAGRGNAEGATLLSGDGHLPLSIPPLLYQMGSDTSVFGTGGPSRSLLGLYFPGIPLMALGTNSSVAYSFTYLYGDLTDWYAEEVQLDAMGRPTASRFGGAWRSLNAVQERYEIANVPALMSVGRTETWTRWTTFDGRWLASIEGRPATRETRPGPGESVVAIQGVLVVPADTNGDGHISAVSFDYTGFDVNNLFTGLDAFERAQTVNDLREAQRGFVAFAQNFVGADSRGSVHYSGYTATPCRSYLPRTGGAFAPGADPRLLLDGTTYGGFAIPLNAAGMPDETLGATDMQRCVIPFADWPSSLDPVRGYVLTSNNDIAAISLDNNLANDRYYLGGPWDVGYRARTVSDTLARHVAARTSSIDAMAALQADHRSNVAVQVFPYLRDAILAARTLAAAGGMPPDPNDARLLAVYQSERAGIDETERRLDAWIARGANAASGVTTFYDTPTADDRTDAAATMLFNAWYRALQAAIFDDEGIDEVFATDARFLRITALVSIIEGRGPGNPRSLASWNPATEESAFFDVLGTPDVERSREVALLALGRALVGLRAPSTMPGRGGFGTSDMSQYLWGLRHQVALESIVTAFASGVMGIQVITNQVQISPARLPLAPDLPVGDPRRDLPWFPRPGDYFAVDAANPPNSGPDYVYRSGPVMRMVIELRGGRVRGQNVIPGGESGVARSANFDDQARLWLGNRALPMRYDVDAVVAGAIGREIYRP